MPDKNSQIELQKIKNRDFLSKVDLLKENRDLNDVQVSKLIGLTDKQHLNKIRTGQLPGPFEVAVRLYDLLGYDITRELIFGLMPEKYAERFRSADNERT